MIEGKRDGGTRVADEGLRKGEENEGGGCDASTLTWVFLAAFVTMPHNTRGSIQNRHPIAIPALTAV